MEKLLIVDDIETQRKKYEIIAKKAIGDCQIFMADNGKGALEIIKSETDISVVILDINFSTLPEDKIIGSDPHRDGYIIAHRLREIIPDLQIVLTTCLDELDEPFVIRLDDTPSDIKQKIKLALRIAQLERENKELRRQLYAVKTDEVTIVGQSESLMKVLRLDALLYQYLHEGIKHIVVAPLETQLEIGDFQNSEADLKELVELSRQKFTDIDELLDVPLFALNLKRLEEYVNQTELPIEDRVRLTIMYARKLKEKCRFLREQLIRQRQTRNIHQIINVLIQQNANIEIIREFAQSPLAIAPETDSTFDIVCEENLIHQALVNLVDNAITAMAGSETKRLTFQTQLTTEEVVVKVIDTGCGIPAERQPRLFTEGSGLKIARSNIEIHAGSLELERSEVGLPVRRTQTGAGSAFSITLPRKLPSMR